MKIAIDISPSVYQGGVGRYTRELVSHLLKIDHTDEYVLFGSSLRRRNVLNKFTQSLITNRQLPVTRFYPIPPTILEFLFNRFHFSIDPLIGKVDVFHSSDWTQPRTKAKKVTTIHDLAVLKFPKLFHPKIVKVQKRRLELVKKECDVVIAVSKNTKKDIIETLKIPERKIVVIYEAASEAFKPKTKEEINNVKNKFGIKKDYILTVITKGERKNLAKLIDGFKLLEKDFDLNLVVVGDIKKGNRKNIISTGFLEDRDLAALYSGASVFVYPSIYEGFGLPVLEAAACGAPIICSKTSSLPEVGGEAAIYVNPNSTEEIVSSIQKLLTNKKITQYYSQASLKRATEFSWKTAARKTLKVYQELQSL